MRKGIHLQRKLSQSQDLHSASADKPLRLPKWTFPFFVVAMTLSISSFFLKAYFVSEPFGHRMLSVIESPDDFHNVTWDDLVTIPAMNRLSNGSFFSDPWNSYNPDYKGWGLGSLMAILGGVFIHLFGDYFISMFMWGLINFSLMIILIYHIFRGPPFEFSEAASIVGTFLLLNLLWIGGQKINQLFDEALPRAIITGWHFSLVELESGLFTYLPYILFLATYWRFVAAPSWRRAVFVGGTAGLLTYIYFFHYTFAFAMIAGHMALSFAFRQKREALYLAGALGVGLFLAVPAVINNFVFITNTASLLFVERIDYNPGRSPFQDYHWFLRFQIPFIIGFAYFVLRKPSEIKSVMMRTWVVLAIAYIIVLHMRVLVGSMQAVDHFWRLSLGIPASLWCILAALDLARFRLRKFEHRRKMVYIAAVLLPILILARTTVDAGYFRWSPDATSQLSGRQLEILERLDCLEKILKPGEGFLTVDPALNYHTMVNLKGLPFMAMGISAISIDDLSERYLLSAYLTGRDKISYPPFGNRKAPEYTNAKDTHLYLYVNLFLHSWSDRSHEQRIKRIYEDWDPLRLDWNAWANVLSTIRAVYVENEYINPAMERLERLFSVEKVNSCKHGIALRVNFKGNPGYVQSD
jgi:hypothetical protein